LGSTLGTLLDLLTHPFPRLLHQLVISLWQFFGFLRRHSARANLRQNFARPEFCSWRHFFSAACQFSTTVIGGRGTALEVDGAAMRNRLPSDEASPKYTRGGTLNKGLGIPA
jgi:hypothetical protein